MHMYKDMCVPVYVHVYVYVSECVYVCMDA